jgi:hypothetical protein
MGDMRASWIVQVATRLSTFAQASRKASQRKPPIAGPMQVYLPIAQMTVDPLIILAMGPKN